MSFICRGWPYFVANIYMARISSIVFDKHEQLKRATIITTHGTVQVQWIHDYGDSNWFTSGNLEAKKLAVPVIQRIERMAETL